MCSLITIRSFVVQYNVVDIDVAVIIDVIVFVVVVVLRPLTPRPQGVSNRSRNSAVMILQRNIFD